LSKKSYKLIGLRFWIGDSVIPQVKKFDHHEIHIHAL